MNISEAGRSLVKQSESCELTAYPDPASSLAKECLRRHLKLTQYAMVPSWPNFDGRPWTVGYGATGPGIKNGTTWTQAQCDKDFDQRMDKLDDVVTGLVKGKATQHQFDALCSFAYNVGTAALAGSTLLKLHLAGNYKAADAEFDRWVKARGTVLQGLVTRRNAEEAMYAEADVPAPVEPEEVLVAAQELPADDHDAV